MIFIWIDTQNYQPKTADKFLILSFFIVTFFYSKKEDKLNEYMFII